MYINGGVVSATKEQFSDQMKYLRAHRNVISMSEFLQFIEKGESLPKNATLLTFDDGYIDNYKIALPILLENKLKATFFITTGFIDHTYRPWPEDIAFIVKSIRDEYINIPEIGNISLQNEERRKQAYRSIIRYLKENPSINPTNFTNDLATRYKINFMREYPLFMSWDQIKKLSDNGMEIAPHTVSHPMLSSLGDKLIKEEILESTNQIIQHLGSYANVFAYPFGTDNSYNKNVKQVLHEMGFNIAFTAKFGSNAIGQDTDYLALNRINIDCGVKMWKFKTLIKSVFEKPIHIELELKDNIGVSK